MSERIPALDELREGLRAAAARDIAAAAPRRRRRRRRATGLLAIGLLGAAGAAGAAELIATGEPVRDDHAIAGYRPAAGLPQISVVARDGHTAWAVRVYTARNGQRCVLAGRLNGVALGVVRDGAFHPYPRGLTGSCNRPARPFGTTQYLGGQTLVFGVARPGAQRVVVTVDGRARPAATGRLGGFLLVYKGAIANDELKIGYGG